MHQAAFHPASTRDIKNLPMQLLDKLNNSIDEILNNPFIFELFSLYSVPGEIFTIILEGE